MRDERPDHARPARLVRGRGEVSGDRRGGDLAPYLGRRRGGRFVATTVNNTGGYAQLALAQAANVYAVPTGLPLDRAVAVFQAGAVAVSVLAAMHVQPGETVLITAAAGRIGSLLVQPAPTTSSSTSTPPTRWSMPPRPTPPSNNAAPPGPCSARRNPRALTAQGWPSQRRWVVVLLPCARAAAAPIVTPAGFMASGGPSRSTWRGWPAAFLLTQQALPLSWHPQPVWDDSLVPAPDRRTIPPLSAPSGDAHRGGGP